MKLGTVTWLLFVQKEHIIPGIKRRNEPQHDKINKVTVRPCGQQRLWSDWADAQANLSLRWAHSHIVGFVMSRLK